MKVLVVGGAGYIGSHMVKKLLAEGYDVTTLDNLSTGYKEAIVGGNFIRGDLGNKTLLREVFTKEKFDGVMHFASSSQVGESVMNPSLYYNNNVTNTLNLLDAMVEAKVKHLVFSSTAAIFGVPNYTPIDEKHALHPINPYGRSKRMIEEILEDYDQAYALKSVSLRYFNAAGADPAGDIGERHNPETHLIPILLQVASGKRDSIYVYGNDYETQDGTCIRDYIHVSDICDAHMAALKYLQEKDSSICINLGNGVGFSVNEVIKVVEKVTGQLLSVIYTDRRQGDPAVLVADARLAKKTLGWKPLYPSLDAMVRHAWLFEKNKTVNAEEMI